MSPLTQKLMSAPRARFVVLAAAAALLSAPVWALAQSTPPPAQPAPLQGDEYQGVVTSIDPSSQSFVITTTFGDRNITVDTTAKTQFHASQNIHLTGLSVGDRVRVAGPVDPTQYSVSARRIQVLEGKKGMGKAGQAVLAGRAIVGTIATLSPSLTLTGEDGKTYTVVPVRPGIAVTAPQPAAFADIAVGDNVTVHGKADGADTLTAHAVAIRPAHAARAHKKRVVL